VSDDDPLVILTIDDEETIRLSFRNYLEDAGYEVLEASDGREGLAVFAAERPDLVLVDLRMPEVDGLEVVARIVEDSPDTPIIVVSGTGTIADAIESARQGAWDFLLKPIEDLAVLRHVIDKSLERADLLRETRRHQEHLESEVIRRTEQLGRRQEQFKTVIEASRDAIVAVDRQGRIILFNPAAERIFGVAAADIKGDLLDRLLPGDLGEEHRGHVQKFLEADESSGAMERALELQARKMDGTLFPVEISISSGQVSGESFVLAIIRDVTARKRAEEELHQAQKSESIGRLAGGVAHDFNNLLSPILGYTEMLLLGMSGGDPRHDDLQQIQKAALRARDLTQQLLAFSRKQVLEITVIELGQAISGLQAILRRTIREDVEIEVRLADAPSRIRADVTQIEQILMNLAVNAQDAMPDGGRFLIETVNLETPDRLPAPIAGPQVVLKVSDTGTGMSAEVLDNVFEPFFTTKEKGKGTGLGLATVYGIVKQHEGHVSVDSLEGRGTTFEIRFPLVAEEISADSPQETTLEGERGTETVLVVEDDDGVRRLVCSVLAHHGYRVIDTTGAEECLRLVAAHAGPIDLMLTDVVMPQMNGRELYLRLALLRPDLEVLFMSGYTSDEIAHHGVLDDGVELIQKPVRIRTLTGKVREILDRRYGARLIPPS
jgi:PAS domain S-box-containing protein